MAKRKGKRKLTAAEKAEKKRRRKEFMTIFVHGKMKRVPRPPTIDGMDVDEFIRRNADPIWLVQNEMWELLHEYDMANGAQPISQSPEEDWPEPLNESGGELGLDDSEDADAGDEPETGSSRPTETDFDIPF
jgi:hypothetical protein